MSEVLVPSQQDQSEKWQVVDEELGIWIASYLKGFSRSVAIRLKDNSFAIYSPGKGLAWDFQKELRIQGDVKWLIAPSSFHNIGLSEWKELYPEARIVAPSMAIKRLKKLGISKFIGPLKDIGPLPDCMQIFEGPHIRIGETLIVFSTVKGTIWVLSDSIFNFSKYPKSNFAKTFAKINDAAPGLKMSRLFKLGLKSRKKYKNWLLNLLELNEPTILIPSHGEIGVHHNLAAQLKELIENI